MAIIKIITNYDFSYVNGWIQYSHESPNFSTYCKLFRWRHTLTAVNKKHKLLGSIVPPRIHTPEISCITC